MAAYTVAMRAWGIPEADDETEQSSLTISHATTVELRNGIGIGEGLEDHNGVWTLASTVFGYTSYTVLPDLQTVNFASSSHIYYSATIADGQPLINDLAYYSANLDVALSGMDAETHWATYGYKEGRSLGDSPFDVSYYLGHNQDVAAAGVDPLAHYLTYGASEGRDPNALFDTSFYLEQNADVKASGMNAYVHYLEFGRFEGRDPNALFDASAYAEEHREVRITSGDAWSYYLQTGWKEGDNPSAAFDAKAYLADNPDVAAAGVNPLEHYLEFGQYEGREAHGVA